MAERGLPFLSVLESIPGFDRHRFFATLRARKVQDMWREVCDPVILPHTNRVYLLTEEGRRILKVFVDGAIYAAELNSRRELIKLMFLERFSEPIDEFQISVSRGTWKREHPFADKAPEAQAIPPRPLTAEEEARLEESIDHLPEGRLKDSFRKAMIADLRWKKAENDKNAE